MLGVRVGLGTSVPTKESLCSPFLTTFLYAVHLGGTCSTLNAAGHELRGSGAAGSLRRGRRERLLDPRGDVRKPGVGGEFLQRTPFFCAPAALSAFRMSWHAVYMYAWLFLRGLGGQAVVKPRNKRRYRHTLTCLQRRMGVSPMYHGFGTVVCFCADNACPGYLLSCTPLAFPRPTLNLRLTIL